MGLFKTFTYNVFDYKPRYYNPKIDDLHDKVMERRREAGKDKETTNENYVPGASIRGSFRSNMKRKSYGGTKKSTIRIFCFAALLFFIAYIILFVDLSSVVSYFMNK